jgi:hypothetical protein
MILAFVCVLQRVAPSFNQSTVRLVFTLVPTNRATRVLPHLSLWPIVLAIVILVAVASVAGVLALSMLSPLPTIGRANERCATYQVCIMVHVCHVTICY